MRAGRTATGRDFQRPSTCLNGANSMRHEREAASLDRLDLKQAFRADGGIVSRRRIGLDPAHYPGEPFFLHFGAHGCRQQNRQSQKSKTNPVHDITVAGSGKVANSSAHARHGNYLTAKLVRYCRGLRLRPGR